MKQEIRVTEGAHRHRSGWLVSMMLLVVLAVWIVAHARDAAALASAPDVAADGDLSRVVESAKATDGPALPNGDARVRLKRSEDAGHTSSSSDEAEGTYRIRVRVVDESGAAVVPARVTLDNFESGREPPLENVGDDGRATLSVPKGFGDFESLRVVAYVAGATTTRSLAGCAESDEVVIVMRGIGRIEIEAPTGNHGGDISASEDGESVGEALHFVFRSSHAKVAVGLGLLFSLRVFSGGEKHVEQVIGPTRAGEVVRVACDARRCAVSFTLEHAGRALDAGLVMLVDGSRCTFAESFPKAGGTRTSWIPRSASARIVIPSGSMSFESQPMSLGDVLELGRIEAQPMKDFGVVEARMPDGSLSTVAPRVSAFVHADGTRLEARGGAEWLASARMTGAGAHIASLRMFSAVEVRVQVEGCYAEPPFVTLTGGSRVQVLLHRGSRVQIVSSEAIAPRRMALRHRATGEVVWAGRSELEADRRVWPFVDLRPGDYDVRMDGMSSSPSSVHVPAGSTQRVPVVLTEK